MALGPREDLDRRRRGGQRDRAAGDRARLVDRALEQQRSRQVGGQHRRHQVRAAAVVLLERVARVLAVLLVGGDRLVLDAVVGRELTAAQREQRRRERDQRRGELARDA